MDKNMNNDKVNDNYDTTIDNSTLRIATLEKEYDRYLKLYQIAQQNRIKILNSSSSNPCEKYKLESKGISQECYNKIWADQGCTTQGPTIGDWQEDQTYDGLVNDSYLWATLTDTDHRSGCYGESTEYTTKTEPTYSIGKEFAALPGRTWWGTFGLKEGAAETKDDCESMCAADSSCTGATFNPVKKYCWTRGGDGSISVGQPDDYALIPKLRSVTIILNGINNKLMDINEELRAETKKLNPVLKQEKQENESKQQKFDQYYNDLSDDKLEMAKLLNQYNSIESDLNDQTLFVEQQNLSYRMWVLVTIILLLVTFKKLTGVSSESPSVNKIINMALILAIIMLIYCLSKPSGFASLGLAIILLLIYNMKSGSHSESSAN
jgi:hypothetical protein